MEFKDCEYRYTENDTLYCENKYDKDNRCDNCKNNVHLNCDHYNPKKDFCLKFFEHDASTIAECKEKTVFNDKELSRKWSNQNVNTATVKDTVPYLNADVIKSVTVE